MLRTTKLLRRSLKKNCKRNSSRVVVVRISVAKYSTATATTTASTPRKQWNPDDSKIAFANKSTKDLWLSFLLYNLTGSKSFVKLACETTERAITNDQLWSKPITSTVKNQYFPLFVAGESLDDCFAHVAALRDAGVKVVLDESVEETPDVSRWEQNKMNKINTIKRAAEIMPRDAVDRFSFKLTAMTKGSLFEDMTDILRDYAPEDGDPRPYMTTEDLNLLNDVMDRSYEICETALTHGMRLWLDAEQYNRQPAMNFTARLLFEKFNRDSGLILNTYQMYLKESRGWMDYDLKWAHDRGVFFGAKIVRGAYIEHETERASAMGYENPIWSSKAETDENYNKAIRRMIEGIANDDRLTLVVASHNRKSLEVATSSIDEFGLNRSDPRIATAQLFGMCDNLTMTLGEAGFNALKFLPFGPFEDVMPYLLRRLQENQDVLNGSANERQLIWRELQRRRESTDTEVVSPEVRI